MVASNSNGGSKSVRNTFLCFLAIFLPLWSLANIVQLQQWLSPDWAVQLLMWSPGVAALLTMLLRGIPLREVGWRPGSVKVLLAGYGLPLLAATVVYLGLAGTGLITLNFGALQQEVSRALGAQLSPVLIFAITGSVAFLFGLLPALGEEIGWRGFLTPLLRSEYSVLKTSLIVGVIWAAYHYPGLLLGEYHGQGNRWLELSLFTVMILAMSVIMTCLRERSASVWPAAIFHASHNCFLQAWYGPMTVQDADSAFWAGEFGAGMAVVYSVLAVGMVWWQKRNGVVAQHSVSAVA